MSKTVKELNAAISSIARRGKALRNDSHKTLVDVCDHYIEHGDYTLFPKLFDAVKNSLGSSLSAAMIQWVKVSVPSLRWDDETKSFITNDNDKARRFAELKDVPTKSKTKFTGEPKNLPFFELEREVKQEPFDLSAAILTLVKRAESAYEKNVKEGQHNIVNAAQVAVLKAMAETIKDVRPEADAIEAPEMTDAEAKEIAKLVDATAEAPKVEEAAAEIVTPKARGRKAA
jgi:hypothetical protein